MKLLLKLTAYLSIVVVIIFFVMLQMFKNYQRDMLLNIARTRAKTLFQMIVITRQWVAENRDKIKPVPAIATKELSNYAKEMAEFNFHITSDKLVNPKNKPDKFEISAMNYFKEKKTKEFFRFEKNNKGETVFRYMAPLYINKSCLKCHYYQGYKIGDFRGGISVTIPVSDLENYVKNSVLFLTFSVSSIYLAIIGFITILFYFSVLKPLFELRQVSLEIEKGDLSKRANYSKNDEIGELVKSFNSMVDKLASNELKLKNELEKLTKKYNEIINQIETQKENLKKANLYKTEILDLISHEIRTPMTKILTYAELLERNKVKEDKELFEKIVSTVKRNVKTLSQLFDNILTFTRIESEQSLEFVPVNLCKLFEEVLGQFKEEIESKQLEVELKCKPKTMICVDVDYFPFAVQNLVSNAVKFSNQGGKIEISAERTEKGVVFEIFNTGEGLEQEEMNKLFKRFFRGKKAKHQTKGIGLGLSIVSRIVKNHDGEISVSSKKGEFAKFTVFIPSRTNLNEKGKGI